MALFTRRRRDAVVASAAPLDAKKEAAHSKRMKMKWQARAYHYYDINGVCYIAAQFWARALGQCRLYPAIRDPATGDIREVVLDADLDEGQDPIPDAEAILEQWNRVQDPGGGRQTMQEQYGRNMFLAGEGNLTATINDDTELEVWEFLSIDEIQVDGDGRYKRFGDEGVTPKQLTRPADGQLAKGNALVYRMWRPHPRYSQRADSPCRGILDDLEEITLLTATVHAYGISRVSGPGILLMPTEVSEGPPKPVGDENPLEDSLMEEMVEAFTTPVADQDSPTAVTPMLLRGPAEALKEVRMLRITDPAAQFPADGQREKAIARVGVKLDMPAQKLTGTSGESHWNAWLADEEAWDHIGPEADRMCADFANVVLRPLTKAAGVADWENVCIGCDNSEVVQKPDQSDIALQLYDAEVIGPRATREATGFKESDAPTPDDLLVMRANKAAATAPAQPADPNAPVDGNSTDKAAPPMVAPADTPVVAAADRQQFLHSQVGAAAEVAVDRSRELAGSRLWRTASNSCPDCAAAVKDEPRDRIAAMLGAETLASISAPDAEALVAGGTDALVRTLTRWGLDEATVARVAAAVRQHAADTLLELDPAPIDVTSLLEAA